MDDKLVDDKLVLDREKLFVGVYVDKETFDLIEKTIDEYKNKNKKRFGWGDVNCIFKIFRPMIEKFLFGEEENN